MTKYSGIVFKNAALILTALASLTIANSARADGLNFHDLSPEEQALYDKGAFEETYDPTKHSGHEIDHILATSPNGKHENKLATPEAILSFNFGMGGRSTSSCGGPGYGSGSLRTSSGARVLIQYGTSTTTVF
jgi:hypothetical protein